jgi:hypothetical protein
MEAIEPVLKKRVILTILGGIERLETFPLIAKASHDEKYEHMRELFVPFGGAGYSVLYEYKEEVDIVLIASIRHTKEYGYKFDP